MSICNAMSCLIATQRLIAIQCLFEIACATSTINNSRKKKTTRLGPKFKMAEAKNALKDYYT